jgi:hypothetical protein
VGHQRGMHPPLSCTHYYQLCLTPSGQMTMKMTTPTTLDYSTCHNRCEQLLAEWVLAADDEGQDGERRTRDERRGHEGRTMGTGDNDNDDTNRAHDDDGRPSTCPALRATTRRVDCECFQPTTTTIPPVVPARAGTGEGADAVRRRKQCTGGTDPMTTASKKGPRDVDDVSWTVGILSLSLHFIVTN